MPAPRRGRVTYVLAGKEYGFISPDEGGRDFFFHRRDVRGAHFSAFAVGRQVTFIEQPDQRGPHAADVRLD